MPRRKGKRRPKRPHRFASRLPRWIGPQRLRIAIILFLAAATTLWLKQPPIDPDDLCGTFDDRRSWYRSAERSFARWGVPVAVQMAIIYQESSFRAWAKPPRRKFLWILPGPRPTSAFGYGQVLDGTWRDYQRSTERPGADRDDFGDVTDFIGWYADRVHRRTGIAKDDPYRLYLAYHEGPEGYARGTHNRKAWLLRVARRVATRAATYQRQYDGCRDDLAKWWSFW